MAPADWIAFGSAIAAVIAAILTWGQLRLQRSTARGDLQAQFDELVHKLATLVYQQPSPGSDQNTAEVKVLVSEATGLLSDGRRSKRGRASGSFWRNRVLRRPVESGPKADSFSCQVLAASYGIVGDIKSAIKYWDLAVKRSQGDPFSRVTALQGRAQFFYSVWRDDEDIRKGRRDFKEALRVLNVRTQGNDTVHEQNAFTLILRAQCESGLGSEYEAKAVKCVERAWQTRARIVSLSHKDAITAYIVEFAARTGPEKFKDKDPELYDRARSWPNPPAQQPPSGPGAIKQEASAVPAETGDGHKEDRVAPGSGSTARHDTTASA